MVGQDHHQCADHVAVWEPKREVRRVKEISRDEVMARHMSGDGEPLVVSGAMRKWPAMRWTIDGLASRYGSDTVLVNDKAPLFEWEEEEMQTVRSTVAEYAAYARGESVQNLPQNTKWYLNSWTPFGDHPELLDEWEYPDFVDDALKHDPEEKIPQKSVVDYSKVFLGVAGCTTRLHFDSLGTHAWLAQLQGRKQFILFAPSDAEGLRIHDWEDRTDNSYQGLKRAVDLTQLPDPVAYPKLRNTLPFVTTLKPGELILIPRGWWHFARFLDSGITLMRNFANDTNAPHFRQALTRANEANDRSTPTLLSAEACVHCRSRAKKVHLCSRCRTVAYCSRDCQKAHFTKHHKHFCSLLAQVGNTKTKVTNDSEYKGMHPSQHLFSNDDTLNKAPSFAKKILRPGRGRFPPAPDSMISVHYETFLADGQKIDSSLDHDKPVNFFLGRASLAQGWRDATATMLLGEKAQVAVPPSAAYGAKGVLNKVPPNAFLIFEIDLLAIF